MRKIIEERLENAKLDYQSWTSGNGINEPEWYELKGQIEAYQDCLNLLPPKRTEQEILKECSVIHQNNENYLIFSLESVQWVIEIHKPTQSYRCYDIFTKQRIARPITMQEHKLLNELFICWRWV